MARVLIVDDDVASLAAARQAVRAAGHEPAAVTSAADARAALESRAAPEVLLVAPRADAGEALALATAVSERGHPFVMLIGEATGAPSALPSLATPLVPATVAARIAAGLGRLAGGAEARRANAPAASMPGPAGEQAPPSRPPSTMRSASVAAEAALRALFRRSAPGRPTTAPPAGLPPPPPSAAVEPRASDPTDAPAFATSTAWPDLGAAAPPAVSAPSRDLDALQECARTRDYFQVLGLQRDATGASVRAAVSRLLNELDTVRLSAEAPAAMGLEELRQVIIDAGDVLGDDARRSHYLRAIAREGRG